MHAERLRTVWDVPANGSKLAALLNEGMHEAQPEDQALEGHRLVAAYIVNSGRGGTTREKIVALKLLVVTWQLEYPPDSYLRVCARS